MPLTPRDVSAMKPILTRAERARDLHPDAYTTSCASAEEWLMRLADQARRTRSAIDRHGAKLIMTDPADRPRVLEDGRISVTEAAWHTLTQAREEVEALMRLAEGVGAEGRHGPRLGY